MYEYLYLFSLQNELPIVTELALPPPPLLGAPDHSSYAIYVRSEFPFTSAHHHRHTDLLDGSVDTYTCVHIVLLVTQVVSHLISPPQNDAASSLG